MKTTLVIGAATALGFLTACTSPAATGKAAAAGANGDNSCLRVTDISEQTIVSDQEIQFKLRNGEMWVNKLPRACFGLKLSGGFSWEVHNTSVCSNQERITVKDTGTPCLLGAFTKVAAPPAT